MRSDEAQETLLAKQRQEDRNREMMKIEALEKRVNTEEGNLKRLGMNLTYRTCEYIIIYVT